MNPLAAINQIAVSATQPYSPIFHNNKLVNMNSNNSNLFKIPGYLDDNEGGNIF